MFDPTFGSGLWETKDPDQIFDQYDGSSPFKQNVDSDPTFELKVHLDPTSEKMRIQIWSLS